MFKNLKQPVFIAIISLFIEAEEMLKNLFLEDQTY
jgi:hypothetical protein